MTGKKKDPNKTYNSNWGGKREGAGLATGRNVGHNGGRKPPKIPKKQRTLYLTDEEYDQVKDFIWDVLRKDESQKDRKHKVNK